MDETAKRMAEARRKWRQLTICQGYEHCWPIVAAYMAGYPARRIAASRASAYRRGLRDLYGFDARTGNFLTRGGGRSRRTQKEMLGFSLSLHTYQASREMIPATALLDELTAKYGSMEPDRAVWALAGVWEKLMAGWLPYALARSCKSPDQRARTYIAYVRGSLNRRVTEGGGQGTLRPWAEAVRKHARLHTGEGPEFENVLSDELPAAVFESLAKMTTPMHLRTLPSKVEDCLKKLHLENDDALTSATVFSAEKLNALTLAETRQAAARASLLDDRRSLLPLAQRQVFDLKRQGLDEDEIAESLNIPLNTVYQRWFQARKTLKKTSE